MRSNGLTRTETLNIIGKKKYNPSPRVRQNAVDLIERILNDDEVGYGTQIKAIECLLKMDLVDVAAEKDDAAAAAATAEPHVVLLLPPNGTETTQ